MSKGSLLATCAAVTCVGIWVGLAGASAKVTNLSCNGTFHAGGTYDNIDVPAGAVCSLDGQTVNNNVTIEGQLIGSDLTVHGDVLSNKGQVVQIDTSTIDGDVTLKKLHGAPVDVDPVALEDLDVGGNETVQKSTGGTGDYTIATNTVHGNVNFKGNHIAGDAAVVDQTVDHDMTVSNNDGGGTKETDANHVTGKLKCHGNLGPFESHGNVAGHFKGGQCHP
jgi:hypothetical protein